MDIKTTLLILVNLVLIEILTSICPAWILGVMLSETSEQTRIKKFRVVLISYLLVIFFVLIFASYFIQVLWLKWVAVVELIIVLVYLVKLRKRNNPNVPLFLLIIVVVTLQLIKLQGYDQSASVLPMVAFTDNIYMIILGFLLSIISFGYILYWIMKGSLKYPFIKWFGYWLLLAVIVEIIFSDSVMSIIPGWHTTIVPIDYIISLLGIVLIGYFVTKYFWDKRVVKK